MAESDFLSYNSSYDKFSKGPKSVYYALGDEMLPGAILNVPQDDDDDEWGRTERIALERSYDFIGKIYKTLFDPYNSMPEISIVPGEAGSELNIAKNMIKLIGRPGVENGVFNLETPELNLGNVNINGDTDTISIGSGINIEEDRISFFSNFNITYSSNVSNITFKNVSVNLNDDGSTRNVVIDIDGKKYTFTKDGLELDTGLLLKIGGDNIFDTSGNLITKNIYPYSDTNYEIGSSALMYRKIYVERATSPYICASYIQSYVYNTINIGKSDLTDIITLYNNRFQVLTSLSSPSFDITSTLITLGKTDGSYDINSYATNFRFFTPSDMSQPALLISNGWIYTNRDIVATIPNYINLGNDVVRFNNIYGNNINSNTGMFNGELLTQDIVPNTNDTYKIGDTGLIYRKVHTKYINDIRGIYNSSGGIVICGYSGDVTIVGDTIVVSSELITRDLRPWQTYNTLGTVCGAYYGLYLRDHVTSAIRFIYVSNGVLTVV